MAGNILPRYDEDSNESRHGAATRKDCEKMAKRQRWELKRIEGDENGKGVLKVDCVFEGYTEFPESFYEGDDND